MRAPAVSPTPSSGHPAPSDDRVASASSTDLDALYAPPSERIQNGVMDRLLGVHRAYLAKARFFCLSTGRGAGLDASPRGGPPGFVHVLDAHTIAFADWPGNNRIESLRNLQEDDRLGLLFLFPGLEIFMRINGHGRIATDRDLLQALQEGQHVPKVATVVRIDEVLMHCGKAINRAGLWEESARLAPAALPGVGSILSEISQWRGASEIPAAQMAEVDQHYAKAVRTALY